MADLYAILSSIRGVGSLRLHHTSLTVEDEFNGARTATIELDVKDYSPVTPLRARVCVFYLGLPIIDGPVVNVARDFSEGSVTLSVHDPSYYAKRNYHRYGDVVVDVGYPLDGRGVRRLWESTIPMPNQLERGVVNPGVLWGYDNTIKQGPRPANLEKPKSGDGIWAKIERGANVFETMQQITEPADGPDWWMEPISAQKPPKKRGTGGVVASGTYVAGYFAELNTVQNRGTDLGTMPFHYGHGRANVAEFSDELDGTAVENYVVSVYPGGERDENDKGRKALRHIEDGWLTEGIMQRWESANSPYTVDVLGKIAEDRLRAYGKPLNPVEIKLEDDTTQSDHPWHDYNCGDIIHPSAKRDGMSTEASVTIRSISLSEERSESQGLISRTVELTTVPRVGDVDISGDSGD